MRITKEKANLAKTVVARAFVVDGDVLEAEAEQYQHEGDASSLETAEEDLRKASDQYKTALDLDHQALDKIVRRPEDKPHPYITFCMDRIAKCNKVLADVLRAEHKTADADALDGQAKRVASH